MHITNEGYEVNFLNSRSICELRKVDAACLSIPREASVYTKLPTIYQNVNSGEKRRRKEVFFGSTERGVYLSLSA